MKRTFIIFFTVGLSLNLTAQKQQTSQDSIKVFYDALFSKLKEGYLHKDAVNWKLVESETKKSLSKYTDFKKSLNEIEPLFIKIDATHCGIYYKGKNYGVTVDVLPESFNDQWKKKYATHPGFEAKVIDGKYGYILMPALTYFDLKSRNVNKIAQDLYDQIVALKTKNELEGWIIDLRFNSGGNSWHMLLALYDFLGDNDVVGTLDGDKKLVSMTSLNKGNYLEDYKKQYRIKPKGKLLDQTKVAVITGVITASSGEITAMAFKSRPNTVFIGENSLGATTTNYATNVPFDITMTLTRAYDSDRNGNYYERIIPDILVSKQDNFDDLLLDGNIQEAIKFISEKE